MEYEEFSREFEKWIEGLGRNGQFDNGYWKACNRDFTEFKQKMMDLFNKKEEYTLCKCGHKRDEHVYSNLDVKYTSCLSPNNCLECGEEKGCNCKEFIPQKKPIILDNNEASLSEYAKEYPENWENMTKDKKGCGKEEMEADYIVTCGKDGLCKECEEALSKD